MSNITGAEIQKMVGHWLHTPEGGYLGSDYGDGASRPACHRVAATASVKKPI